MDFDVTAFVNDENQPFEKVLDDFQDVILNNFDVEEKDMKISPNLVQFVLDDVDFDLLAATNMAKGSQGGNNSSFQEIRSSSKV